MPAPDSNPKNDPARRAFLNQLEQFGCGGCGEPDLSDLALSGALPSLSRPQPDQILADIDRFGRQDIAHSLDTLFRNHQFAFVVFGSKPLARAPVAGSIVRGNDGKMEIIDQTLAHKIVQAFADHQDKLELRLFEPFTRPDGEPGARELIIFRRQALIAALEGAHDMDPVLCQPAVMLDRLRTARYLDHAFRDSSGIFREDVFGVVMGFDRQDAEFWQALQSEASHQKGDHAGALRSRSTAFGHQPEARVQPVKFIADRESRTALATVARFERERGLIEEILSSSDWLERSAERFGE